MVEDWKRAWRAFIPHLPTRGLEALRDALRADDPRLTQGSTTTPPPLMCVADWPVEAACAIGFCGAVDHGGFWKDAHGNTNDGSATVGEVEEFFARACFNADTDMGEPAGCRHWLNFWDDTPRPEALSLLLPEVELALAGRGVAA